MYHAKPKRILTDEEKTLIIELAEIGLTNQEIAQVFHLPRKTFENILNYNNIMATIRFHKGIADQRVEQSLYKKACSGDVSGCIFWLKNRQAAKWRDTAKLEHTLPEGSKVTIEHVKSK